ncbi:MAG: hypothetical protein GXO90_10505 [FCB group bacterium]|nr:hypothetical protein [FCB group bacterium]
MIWPFIQRRLWLTQNRLITTLAFALALPVFLHVVVNLGMKNLVIRSIQQIPYEQWVAPGLVFLLATITLIPIIYRELFDLRIHHKALQSISMAPLSKVNIIVGFLLTAMLESGFFVLVGLIVFSSLTPLSIGISGYLMIVVYIVVLDILNANVLVFLSLLTERVTIYIMLILSMIVLLIFGSGLVIEIEFYPTTVGQFFSWFPTSQLIRGLRMFLFANIFDWISLVYPLLISVLLLFVNAEFLKRKLNQ